MNELLNKYYSLDIIGIIKINDKLFRIKTKENKYYCIKYIEKDNDNIFSNLSLLNINSFVIPYINNYGSYISNHNDKYFYLIDWYNDEPVLVKEIRMKFFIEELIKLHQKSMYNLNINKGHFEERKEYKSPSEWLFLLNNNKFRNSLNKAKEYLKKFKNTINDLNEIRISLNYLNFDFHNIIIKHQKIIGIDKIKKGSIINDLYDIFNKSFTYSIDIALYFKLYFKEIKLLDYEIYWFLTLIMIPFNEYNNYNEIDKIIEITKMIYKINVSDNIEKILLENN